MTRRRIVLAAALDLAAILVFVAIGRAEHDESGTATGIVETAAPFVIGLAVGWGLVRAWRHPMRVVTGLVIWPVTVLVGMVARRALFDEGTAPSFVVVTTLFVGMCLVGWRLVARSVATRGGQPADRLAPPVS